MKLYRVAYYYQGGVSAGQGFFTNERAAQRAAKDYLGVHRVTDPTAEIEIEKIEVELSKQGILDLMRSYAVHPDNG